MFKAYWNCSTNYIDEGPKIKEELIAVSSDKEKLYTFINFLLKDNSLSEDDKYIKIEDDNGQIIEKIELQREKNKI